MGKKKVKDEENKQELCFCQQPVSVNEKGICCDMCSRWLHIACADISEEEYKLINKLGEKVCFLCSPCKEGLKKDNNMMLNEIIKLLKDQDIKNKKEETTEDTYAKKAAVKPKIHHLPNIQSNDDMVPKSKILVQEKFDTLAKVMKKKQMKI